tara:strand:+ start:192 stop:707 length:516 start_codon:yes stop_codon:yes gene_type:complete
MIGFLQKGLLFFVLLVVQVFFIDQLDIGQANFFIAPLVYGLVIISLPPSLEIWLLMVLALIMGLSIDLFRNTIGLNMSSLVMVAFLKNPLLNTIFSKDGYDPLKELNFTTIGWSNFLFFSLVMLFIHHFWFYIIEDFHFNRLHVLLLKALINALISVGFFILVHLITIKRK